MNDANTSKLCAVAAKRLGWTWSAAHNGFINESEKKPNYKPQHEGGYNVADNVHDACYISGLEDQNEVLKYLEDTRHHD